MRPHYTKYIHTLPDFILDHTESAFALIRLFQLNLDTAYEMAVNMAFFNKPYSSELFRFIRTREESELIYRLVHHFIDELERVGQLDDFEKVTDIHLCFINDRDFTATINRPICLPYLP